MSSARSVAGIVCLVGMLAALAGCNGLTSGSPNPTGSFQLTVSSSGSGAGTVTSSPSGINCGKTCSASFSDNMSVTLTATPASGSVFAGWGGACSGTGSCTVKITAATSVTATFNMGTSSLTVTLGGNGTGTVTSNPSGINCGTTCKANFNDGDKVTLTAAPGANSIFTGWSGACSGTGACTVTVSGSESVTATFQANASGTFSLMVVPAGTGTGTVSSSPTGINCGTACSVSFPSGTQVTLTASAGTNSVFGGWSGASCSGTGTCTVIMNANTSITATFNSTIATLTVTLAGSGSGTVSSTPSGISCGSTCTATFTAGTQVTLTTTANPNSYLVNWGGACTGSTCTVTLNADESVTATINSPWPVNHIIFMSQENRSLDHYFGELRRYWKDNGYADQAFDGLPQFNPTPGPSSTNPGCDPNFPFLGPPPATFQDCVYDADAPVTSYHLITKCVENPSPSWNESHSDWNYNDPTDSTGTFLGDGFVHAAGHDSRDEYFYDNTVQYDTNGIRAMGYYDGGNPNDSSDAGDLNYYYYMATQFATSDRWFSPVMSRTELNRDFMIAATSGGYAYPEGTSPSDSSQINATVIYQLLQNAGITWKIYVNTTGTPCETNPTPQCYYDNISYVHTFVYGQTIINQYPQNIVPISQFFTDLAQGTLPQFAYIEPASAAGLDEHAADYDTDPPCCSVQGGANYVSTLISGPGGLMSSQYWKDSVFILTYDEAGGFYDHVAPQAMPSPDGTTNAPIDLLPGDICTDVTGPTCNFGWTGYRVPLIVISPFTKKNYVSHTVADTTAFLKFTETRFGLSSMTQRDAAQIDMSEFFDFGNPPWTTPPTPPAQHMGGVCYLNSLP